MATQRQNWLLLIVLNVHLQAADSVIIIEAEIGEDVCLPCVVQHERKVRLPSPVVIWTVSESGEVLHAFYSGQNQTKNQSERFKGRTQFCLQEILHGNVSLQLKDVTPADFGNYSCHAALYENTPQTLQTVLLKQKNTPGANVPGGPEKLPVILGVSFLILVILAGIFVWCCWCKKKSKRSKEGEEGAAQEMEDVATLRT